MFDSCRIQPSSHQIFMLRVHPPPLVPSPSLTPSVINLSVHRRQWKHKTYLPTQKPTDTHLFLQPRHRPPVRRSVKGHQQDKTRTHGLVAIVTRHSIPIKIATPSILSQKLVVLLKIPSPFFSSRFCTLPLCTGISHSTFLELCKFFSFSSDHTPTITFSPY